MVVATVVPASGAGIEQRGDVAARGLGGLGARLGEVLQISVRPSPTRNCAVHDGDRRRHGARFADNRLDAAGHVEILRIRHAVRNDGRLERHHGLPGCERVGDFRLDGEKGNEGHGERMSP